MKYMSPEHQKLFQNLLAENLKLTKENQILKKPESSGANPKSSKKAKIALENAKVPEKKPKILVENASGLGLELSKEFLAKCLDQIDSDMSPEQKDIFEDLLAACLKLGKLGAEKDEIRNQTWLKQREMFDNCFDSIRTNDRYLWKKFLEPELKKSNK